MQLKSLLNNENGSVIVMALIFLVLLTVLGMSAISTSSIEVQIAGNGMRYKQNLYLAEAAAMEAVQRLEDGVEANITVGNPSAFTWMNGDADVSVPVGQVTNPWQEVGNMQASAVSDPVSGTNPQFAAVSRGITGGTSLGVTTPSQLYTFDVYGIYSGNGLSQVVLGYKKRF